VKKLLFSAVALVAFLTGAVQLPAQEMKPVVSVSIASYDEIMSDVDFIGTATGVPEINRQTLEGQLQQANAADALKALDKAKPMGLVVLTDGQGDFRPIVFLPVTDVKKFIEPFAGALPITVEDAGGGVLKIGSPQPGQEAYAKSQGGYTYLAQSAAQLTNLPADPQTLLGGLDKEYDLGVRAYLQNVPPFFKNIAIGQLKQGVQLGLQREPGEDETAFQVRKRLMEENLKQLETAINEIETFTVGLKIDSSATTVNLDFGVNMQKGSKFAAQIAELQGIKTSHAGFIDPAAAVRLTFTSLVGKEDVESTVAMIRQLEARAAAELEKDASLSDADRATAKDVVKQLVQVGVKTIESGKIDFGSTLFLDAQTLTFVAGTTVADGAQLESALKKLAEAAKSELPFEVKFNASSHGGISFHTASIPVPDRDAQKAFGTNLDVVVGTSGTRFYLAFGRNAESALKKAIDGSGSERAVPPMQLVAALTPIFKFANSMEPNPVGSMLIDELGKVSGKDHASIVVTPSETGVKYRIQLEEGVLRAIGAGARMSHGGGF
jgi:hypothetical protein